MIDRERQSHTERAIHIKSTISEMRVEKENSQPITAAQAS